MKRSLSDRFCFTVGFLLSFVFHILMVIVSLAFFENSEARALKPTEVFTVTLEPGKVLGGVSQVPVGEQQEKVSPPPGESQELDDSSAPEPEKKLTTPSVVEDPEKILEEQKKKEAARLKEDAEKKKALDDRKKKEEEEKKKKAAEEAKKKLEDEKKNKDTERKQRNKRLQDAIRRATKRYEGESTDAGGQGFGAARTGGKGMGGGTLASIEFIAYRNQLTQHIKGGWHWIPTQQVYRAHVSVTMLPDGVVRDARVLESSGDSSFDESGVRAVYKASPLPVPPSGLFEQFREFTITFDSTE